MITIILPTRSNLHLESAIHSVLNALDDIEYILLIIDTSEFGNATVLLNSEKVVLLHAPNASYTQAIYSARDIVTTKYVGLMNDDDLVSKFRFKAGLDAIIQNEADLVTTKLKKFPKRVPNLNPWPPINGSMHPFLLIGPYFANASWIFTRDLYHQMIDQIPDASSWDWIVSLNLFQNKKVVYLNEKSYFYRQHEGQVTKSIEYRASAFDSVYPHWLNINQYYSISTISKNTAQLIAMPSTYFPKNIYSELKLLNIWFSQFNHKVKLSKKQQIWLFYHRALRNAIWAVRVLQRLLKSF